MMQKRGFSAELSSRIGFPNAAYLCPHSEHFFCYLNYARLPFSLQSYAFLIPSRQLRSGVREVYR